MSSVGRSRTWLWALGSVLVVAVLVGSAYVAHHVVVSSRSTPPVPAPAAPPLEVVAVTKPGPSYELLADDGSAGHVVALASASQPICPPIGLCPPAPPLTSFVVFDASSGAILSRTPLGNSAAQHSVLLLVSNQLHVAYAVAPGSVSVFSTISGAALGGYTLPLTVSWRSVSGGVYDPVSQALILAGGGQLAVLDAATGQVLQETQIAGAPSGTPLDGPILDASTGTVYLLAHGTTATEPRLLAYDAVTLDPLSQLLAPEATGLGPLTLDGRYVILYERGGVVSMQPAVRNLSAGGEQQDMPAARGAAALGWNATPGLTGDIYVATPAGIDLRNSGTGKVLASLPMQVDWSGSEALLVDSETGLIYLPGAHGQLVIARGNGAGDGPQVLNAATSVVLAHSALASFLPFTNQDPPFITPDTFLLSATAEGQSIPMTFWIHYSDFQWSLGPYPGTTSAAVIPNDEPGERGGYLVTFTITWNETFLRTHSWVCVVAPNGSVSLRSDSGDIVP